MKKCFLGLIPLIMLLTMCAGGAKTAANSNGMDLDAAIREAATQMESKIPSKTMVALVSVASPSTAFSTQVLTRLESAIVSSGKLVVVDRANLDKVRAEQGFQLSGEVDDESAKSIGKLLGAGAIVTGSLTDLGDVYSLTLKAINIETATVAVSYLADLTKTTRIETLLATRDGATTSSTNSSTTVRAQKTTPAAPVQYTVAFNANGASGTAPSAQTVQNGESITIPDVGAMTNSGRNFGGWNTRADGNGTPYVAGSILIVNANTQLYAKWIERVYKIGDRGPAGGFIFYDKGNSSGGWRYLEAAPVETEAKLNWLNKEMEIAGTRTDLGSGKKNTQLITADLSIGVPEAALHCVELEYGGFRDWFLPSKDELNLMYVNLKRKNIGGFADELYWSSSEFYYMQFAWAGSGDAWVAWIQSFKDANQSGGILNRSGRSPVLVRAIRQF